MTRWNLGRGIGQTLEINRVSNANALDGKLGRGRFGQSHGVDLVSLALAKQIIECGIGQESAHVEETIVPDKLLVIGRVLDGEYVLDFRANSIASGAVGRPSNVQNDEAQSWLFEHQGT